MIAKKSPRRKRHSPRRTVVGLLPRPRGRLIGGRAVVMNSGRIVRPNATIKKSSP